MEPAAASTILAIPATRGRRPRTWWQPWQQERKSSSAGCDVLMKFNSYLSPVVAGSVPVNRSRRFGLAGGQTDTPQLYSSK